MMIRAVLLLNFVAMAGLAQSAPAPKKIEAKEKVAKDKPEPSVDCSKAKPGNPICYAKEVQSMLEEQVKKREAEVAALRKHYEGTAQQFDRNSRLQIQDDLGADRSRRAFRMSKALIAKRMDAWDWKTELREYMLQDFNRMSGLLLSDLENGTAAAFVASLEDLRSDVAKAKKLADLLKMLATPRDLKDELEQWLAYGKEVKDEYQKAACKDVADKKSAAASSRTVKEAALAVAKAKVPPDPKDVEQLTSEIAAMKSQETAYAGYQAEKKCTTK